MNSYLPAPEHTMPEQLQEPAHLPTVVGLDLSLTATGIATLSDAGAWSFILDYPRPPKGLHANDRAHWRTKAGAVADIRMEVMAKTRALRLGELERVRVDVEWVVATRSRRDTDNLAPFLKAIYDGIGSDRGVSARLVEDDDPAHMVKPSATIRYEKGVRPHFLVTITDLGGAA